MASLRQILRRFGVEGCDEPLQRGTERRDCCVFPLRVHRCGSGDRCDVTCPRCALLVPPTAVPAVRRWCPSGDTTPRGEGCGPWIVGGSWLIFYKLLSSHNETTAGPPWIPPIEGLPHLTAAATLWQQSRR